MRWRKVGTKCLVLTHSHSFFFEACLLAADIEGILPLLGKAKQRTITDQWKKSNSK